MSPILLGDVSCVLKLWACRVRTKTLYADIAHPHHTILHGKSGTLLCLLLLWGQDGTFNFVGFLSIEAFKKCVWETAPCPNHCFHDNSALLPPAETGSSLKKPLGAEPEIPLTRSSPHRHRTTKTPCTFSKVWRDGGEDGILPLQ